MLEADFVRSLVGNGFPSELDFAIFSRHAGVYFQTTEVYDGGQEKQISKKNGSRLLASSI